MASEKDSYKIEKFDGANFSFWRMQMEDYLYQKDLYLPMGEKPAEMKDDEWKVLDRKALGAVRLSLTRSVAFNVKDQDTTAALIKALSNMYEQPSAAHKVFLIKKLFNLKMPENGNFREHLNSFNETKDQLKSVDIIFTDEVNAGALLSTMPESWQSTVQSISASFGKNKMVFSEVVDMIMTEEIRRKEEGPPTPATTLNMENRDRN